MKPKESKIYGQRACRAVFARRPDDVLRVLLTDALVPSFGQELKACAQARRPYRVVPADELERITASRHHEGICVVTRPRQVRDPAQVLAAPGPAVILALADVRNPHNVGALLRTAAHFGARAALLSGASSLSAASHRTAEGAAEWLELMFSDPLDRGLALCLDHGFTICATSSHEGESLYERPLPDRLVVLLGGERDGLPRRLMQQAGRRLRIPGTGHVESLNVSAASAVILAESWREHASDSIATRSQKNQTRKPGSRKSSQKNQKGKTTPARSGGKPRSKNTAG